MPTNSYFYPPDSIFSDPCFDDEEPEEKDPDEEFEYDREMKFGINNFKQ
ncbi:MAG: hypothetical protein LBR10_14560 [Prevotellaceae bacterium]|jgi:hypothetical protein|nr:hypothetical protein [Prevotellaceae bacterium]